MAPRHQDRGFDLDRRRFLTLAGTGAASLVGTSLLIVFTLAERAEQARKAET